jgi:hypothetical protein
MLRYFPIKKFLELLVIYSKDKQLESNKALYDSIIVSDFELADIFI